MEERSREEKDRDMQIAKTIMEQLGRRCLFMINAKNLATIERGLSLKMQCRGSKFNYLSIKLNSGDTYDMHFMKIWGAKITNEAKLTDVYVDNLHNMIENHTGLRTSL